jgi:hypothetical protein
MTGEAGVVPDGEETCRRGGVHGEKGWNDRGWKDILGGISMG